MVSEIESAYQSAGNFKKFEIESQAWNEGYVVGFKSLNGAGGCIIVTKGYGLIVGARLEGTWKFKTVVSFSL